MTKALLPRLFTILKRVNTYSFISKFLKGVVWLKKIIALVLCFLMLILSSGCTILTERSKGRKVNVDENWLKPWSEILIENTTEQGDNTEVDMDEINALRPDYNLNDCVNLRGNVYVYLFFLDDFESSWTEEEITAFTENEIKPGLEFLENAAQEYGVYLSFYIYETHNLYYDDKVQTDADTGAVTINALKKSVTQLGYVDGEDFISGKKNLYMNTEVVCMTIFNKEGKDYAINPPRGSDYYIPEHCILFAEDFGMSNRELIGYKASVVAHEILHLFGAEDYYEPDKREILANKHYPSDIMLYCSYLVSGNTVGDATAFYVGWIDTPPDILYNENWNNEE